MRNLENKKKYLAIWLLICLAVVLIGFSDIRRGTVFGTFESIRPI